MKMFRVTERVRSIEYAIRDIIVYAREEERKGRKIIYLNLGDPVKFDFERWNMPSGALIKLRDFDKLSNSLR